MKLPSDFGNEVAKALGFSMKAIEELFEFEEDKEGFFYAKLKPKQFLEKPEFKKMCTLVRELGGDSYLEGMKAWKVPGPYVKKSVEKPSDQGMDSERSYKESRNVIPTEPLVSPQEREITVESSSVISRSDKMKIQISKIRISADNPRKEFNPEKVKQIGESILRHGQIHPIIVRSLPDGFYELVTGEMRVRGCMAVGLEEIDADIRTLTDTECKVLRLIENIHREDLSDAEKGDAVIELHETTDRSYRDISEKELDVPEQTVYNWIWKASRMSPKLGEFLRAEKLGDWLLKNLLKYSHEVQDLLALFIVDWNQKNPDNKISSTNIGNFCKEYDKEPDAELEDIAKKITGFVPVTTWQPKPTVPTTAKASKPKNPKQSLPDLERCITITKKGKRCEGKRLPDLEYCSRHKYEGPRISKPKREKKPKYNSEDVPPLPEGEFDVIYADPPWKYDFTMTERGDPEVQYPTMELEEIKTLKVPSADNAVLFLWATNPKLQEAQEVMKAWGFTYKTNLCWVKDKFGTGYYFRGQHELLLLGVKGSPSVPMEQDRPSSVLNADRQEHSQKPEEIYALIERMYPQRKYLELFQPRKLKREHWTTWGIKLV